MINPGHILTVEDVLKLKELKNSSSYSNYLKTIASSPLFISMMKEHIENINITEDLKKIKNQYKLPEDLDYNLLNDIFKKSLNKLAVSLTADSIILRELEQYNIDQIKNDLNNISEITYMLGASDKTYYIKAKKLFKEGKITADSLVFKGLLAYIKLHPEFENENTEPPIEQKFTNKQKINKKNKTININSDNIQL